MKTRFDIKGIRINRCGVPLSVEEMETAHILNCIKMMVQKPTTTLAMLIQDIESAAFADVWTADSDKCCRESLHNVTSLSAEELVEYIKGTPLVKSMLAEQARMRANKTAASYNEYILKNSFVWEGNVPADIAASLPYI